MNHYSLTSSQKHKVIQQTNQYIVLANNELSLDMPVIEIKFDLKGKSSGMFVVRRNKLCIRYNEIIFSQFFEDSLVNTVAHEVAHYVVFSLLGVNKVKPHGAEWKNVMKLFDVKPEVTSSYDVSQLPLNRQNLHDYSCSCMIHKLSTTRHNKVQKKKAIYNCKKCRQPLRYRQVG